MVVRRLLSAAFGLCLVASVASADVDAKSLEQAKKHYAMGEQLFGWGNYKGAVGEFKEAYRLTRNPVLLYNIGFVYDQLEDVPMTLHYYEKYLSDTPDTAKTAKQRE